jgi:protein ImuB
MVATARAIGAGTTRLALRMGQRTWMPPGAAPDAGAQSAPDPGRPAAARRAAACPAAPAFPPIAVVARAGSALRLAAVDAVAERRGLKPGLSLADARAMVPDLQVAEDDPAGDRAVIEAMADWADRYTPLVALDATGEPAGADTEAGFVAPPGLVLDVTGCAHLFGGEAALLADLIARIRARGYAARAAIAGTPGAAWALARFGRDDALALPPGAEQAALAPLPLAALRLPPGTVGALERVGLKTVGMLIETAEGPMPRGPLGRRFGPLLVRRLDQALGREDEPISPRRAVPALVAERRFAEPIRAEADVAETVRSLAASLALTLEERGEGARGLELAVWRVDGVVTRVTVGTSRPLRDPGLVLGLFAERLKGLGEELDAGYGFETVRLAVLAAARDDPAQIDLSGGARAEADLARLIDRLGARLGLDRVVRLAPRETFIPEAAAAAEPAAAAAPGSAWTLRERPGAEDPLDRPIRLFARPEPIDAVAEVPEGPPIRFRWRRALYDVARYEGPERIAAEWWKTPVRLGAGAGSGDAMPPDTDPYEQIMNMDAPLPPGTPGLTRDYFRIEDREGRRFWVFREGLYEVETWRPRWFLQGLFA